MHSWRQSLRAGIPSYVSLERVSMSGRAGLRLCVEKHHLPSHPRRGWGMPDSSSSAAQLSPRLVVRGRNKDNPVA